EDVTLIDHYVADIDANSKINPSILGQTDIPFSHSLLEFQSAANCVNRAGKLNQHPVAGRFNDATVMLCNFWISEFASVCLEGSESAFLVGPHQLAVANDISREDGGKPPDDALLGHESP